MSQAAPAIAAQHAQRTARAARAYRAHAAHQVCETAVQVHDGIGTTQERLAHLYLRRALHSLELSGSGSHHLQHLASGLLRQDADGLHRFTWRAGVPRPAP